MAELIRIKQLESGELVSFISGTTTPVLISYVSGVSGALQGQIDLLVSASTGVSVSQVSGIANLISSGILTGHINSFTYAVTSGVDFETYGFGITYTGTPRMAAQVIKASGQPTLYCTPIAVTSSGATIEYSNTVGSGYSLNLLTHI